MKDAGRKRILGEKEGEHLRWLLRLRCNQTIREFTKYLYETIGEEFMTLSSTNTVWREQV